jgi:hypothetical protein
MAMLRHVSTLPHAPKPVATLQIDQVLALLTLVIVYAVAYMCMLASIKT